MFPKCPTGRPLHSGSQGKETEEKQAYHVSWERVAFHLVERRLVSYLRRRAGVVTLSEFSGLVGVPPQSWFFDCALARAQ